MTITIVVVSSVSSKLDVIAALAINPPLLLMVPVTVN